MVSAVAARTCTYALMTAQHVRTQCIATKMHGKSASTIVCSTLSVWKNVQISIHNCLWAIHSIVSASSALMQTSEHLAEYDAAAHEMCGWTEAGSVPRASLMWLMKDLQWGTSQESAYSSCFRERYGVTGFPHLNQSVPFLNVVNAPCVSQAGNMTLRKPLDSTRIWPRLPPQHPLMQLLL